MGKTCFLGIDIGGTEIKIGVIDEFGRIVDKEIIRTPNAETLEAFLEPIVRTCNGLIGRVRMHLGQDVNIPAAGGGIPGIFDPQTGDLIFCPNIQLLQRLGRIEFSKELQRRLGINVFIGSDSKNACLAEIHLGALHGVKKNALFLTLGTGIGGSPVYDGKMVLQSAPGHLLLGNSTFAETASTKALMKRASEEAAKNPNSLINAELRKATLEALAKGDAPPALNGKIFFAAYMQKDRVATQVFDEWMERLSNGIASIINLTSAQVIVLGGGVSAMGEIITLPVQQNVQRKILYNRDGNFKVEVKVARFANDAGIIGSAIMALRRTKELEKASSLRRINSCGNLQLG